MNTKDQMKAILSAIGVEKLNQMQTDALDAISENENTLILSPTGSGKTLAYLLPILNALNSQSNNIQCLIVVPSRELAIQIEKVWKTMSTNFKVNTCYGGHSIDTEIKNLRTPPALLIGTPGRLVDHIERKSFTCEAIKLLVLDEFDKSLELGFQDEMQVIASKLINVQKKILLSATSETEIPDFIQFYNPTTINYLHNKENESFELKLIKSPEKDKFESLFELLCSINSEAALIFCNHREATERITSLLIRKGIQAGYYHGGMDQDDRERVLVQFRNGSLNYLVTTDLAARGLDIPDMKHVIHYHLPAKETEFVHRNGRTARMNATGTAYIIKAQDEKLPEYLPSEIETLKSSSKRALPKRPEYSTIYVSGGKKNKLNKSDIVGFFLQKGKLDKNDLGLIEVKDFISFVAVRTTSIKTLLTNIKDEKMKGKKYKIEVARDVSK